MCSLGILKQRHEVEFSYGLRNRKFTLLCLLLEIELLYPECSEQATYMHFNSLTCCELGALLGLGCGTEFVVDWLPATEAPVTGPAAVVVGGACCLGCSCCSPWDVKSLT